MIQGVSGGRLAAGVSGGVRTVADGLAYLRTGIVNVFFVGPESAGDRGWVLVDAGLPGFASTIRDAAEARFGAGSRPSAIVLTHGHFDHVGGLRELAEAWDAPIHAHLLEMPYLTGRSACPPPDPTVGGGAMAALAWAYPRGPVDVGGRVRPLPADGSVPGAPGWRWMHTPGHTAGHVSLFRDADRALVAGDAVVTVRQESLTAVLAQRPSLHGPPAYFTPDWRNAQDSVRALAALEPALVATGHGIPMEGEEMREALHRLARDFDRLAVPAHGRYVGAPAVTDERGIVSLPPRPGPAAAPLLAGAALAALAGLALGRLIRRR